MMQNSRALYSKKYMSTGISSLTDILSNVNSTFWSGVDINTPVQREKMNCRTSICKYFTTCPMQSSYSSIYLGKWNYSFKRMIFSRYLLRGINHFYFPPLQYIYALCRAKNKIYFISLSVQMHFFEKWGRNEKMIILPFSGCNVNLTTKVGFLRPKLIIEIHFQHAFFHWSRLHSLYSLLIWIDPNFYIFFVNSLTDFLTCLTVVFNSRMEKNVVQKANLAVLLPHKGAVMTLSCIYDIFYIKKAVLNDSCWNKEKK